MLFSEAATGTSFPGAMLLDDPTGGGIVLERLDWGWGPAWTSTELAGSNIAPHPLGLLSSAKAKCVCTSHEPTSYEGKISMKVLDREPFPVRELYFVNLFSIP